MKITIGSENVVKVEAVKEIIEPLGHEVVSVIVASGVSDQPFNDRETVQGAENRAKAALKVASDIGIGLEAGVEYLNDQLYLVNWGALVTLDGACYYAGGTRIPLPLELKEALEVGMELAEAIDKYAKAQNLRSKEGAIGILTANFYNRKENFKHITKLLWGQYCYNQHKVKLKP